MEAQEDPLALFEALVADAVDGIPEPFAAAMDEVALIVEPVSPRRSLYGLYEGVPRTHGSTPSLAMPPRITIFMHPMVDHFRTYDALRHQVRVTVLHELGHHLGMDEQQLHDLGYG